MEILLSLCFFFCVTTVSHFAPDGLHPSAPGGSAGPHRYCHPVVETRSPAQRDHFGKGHLQEFFTLFRSFNTGHSLCTVLAHWFLWGNTTCVLHNYVSYRWCENKFTKDSEGILLRWYLLTWCSRWTDTIKYQFNHNQYTCQVYWVNVISINEKNLQRSWKSWQGPVHKSNTTRQIQQNVMFNTFYIL